ncbi:MULTISPECIES: hypothetical protein [Phyllobacteriaceae]|jgi:hypothetical protein|uniref:Uncharacterized protein n=1 Tax=Mesorhizobium hungaricum TaxID=1566387 RepID=A0A1C2DD92_9HYPH|nr:MULTISPECIES: hypothetical protein [Mesorhizobium]MBN9235128.1 hypothetical protein [Mesorhizobium sp.]OCX12673.1 hypothetical protein QV13_24050 [Mesorhizobium hungaricum]
MMTQEFINEYFEIKKVDVNRWWFEPIKWKSPALEHRYFLTFMLSERRFLLSRQKVVEVVSIDDPEQRQAFQGMLSDEDVAGCMRRAMTAPPPEEEDLPF